MNLKPKDVVILRLYLTFLGIEFESTERAPESESLAKLNQHSIPDKEYMQKSYLFFNSFMDSERRAEALNPEKRFCFNDANKLKIKALLVSFKSDNFSTNEISNLRILDILTNVLLEAMQFIGLIPNTLEGDLDELQKAIDSYNQVKNNLIDFKNKVI